MQRQCKVSATARRENFVLPDLILPNRSLLYAKIIKAVCNVNTITLFFSNQEYKKKHKITVLNVKLSLLQTENYAVEIRKTESESKKRQYPAHSATSCHTTDYTKQPANDAFPCSRQRLFRKAKEALPSCRKDSPTPRNALSCRPKKPV